MYDVNSSVNTPGIGTREQWVAELHKRKADAPEEIVDAYMEFAPMANKNYDLAIAQGIVESTGFTDWKWTQLRNPAGIGSTSRQTPGASFPSIRAGISAHYAHQCAYADTAGTCPIETMGPELADLFNDPRHGLVGHQGNPSIQHWEGRWAIPGDNYADSIAAIANAVVLNDPPPQPVPAPKPTPKPFEVVDLRPSLTTNPNGGPAYRNPAKVGIIWHYNGPPPNEVARTQYINDSVDHSHRDFGGGFIGDGIMYHWGVGYDTDGKVKVFKLRDEADVLWHCASWVPGGNETGVSVNVNIGAPNHADIDVLSIAAALGEDIRSRYPIEYEMCKGHQEVSPTACPGTLMEDLVIPFRDGSFGGTVPPVQGDGFLHENGFIIGGGFKSIVDRLESVSHTTRMVVLGYCLSDEGDGYLLSPETLNSGKTTGRYHVIKVVVQKFERNTLVHDMNEPNPEWQDYIPLLNRGYLAGFADDPAINAILEDDNAHVGVDVHPASI